MTEADIQKYGEIQYLKGRLDELHKAFPTVFDLTRKRKLDVRIQKYYDKLKNTDEISYHLYIVERYNQSISKEKSKKEIASLFTEILQHVSDNDLQEKIRTQINKY